MIFLFVSSSHSQIYKGFGIKLGKSIANQVSSPNGFLLRNKYGLTAGLFKETHLFEKLYLVTGINYTQKGSREESIGTNETGHYTGTEYIHRNVNFISFEMLAKYDGNISNYYPYLLAGLRMDIFISSKNILNGNEIGYSRFFPPINSNKTFGGTIGGGFDFRPSKSFTIFIEGVYNPDFTNLGEMTDEDGYIFYLRGNSFDIRTGIKF